jgi:hypothetical protein
MQENVRIVGIRTNLEAIQKQVSALETLQELEKTETVQACADNIINNALESISEIENELKEMHTPKKKYKFQQSRGKA